MTHSQMRKCLEYYYTNTWPFCDETNTRRNKEKQIAAYGICCYSLLHKLMIILPIIEMWLSLDFYFLTLLFLFSFRLTLSIFLSIFSFTNFLRCLPLYNEIIWNLIWVKSWAKYAHFLCDCVFLWWTYYFYNALNVEILRARVTIYKNHKNTCDV